MITFGQICLLAAFVAAGYAAFAGLAAAYGHPRLASGSRWAGWGTLATLSAVMGVLVAGLLSDDLRLSYVAQHGGGSLPWYFRIAALWVGQAGSLLLWAWMLATLAIVFHATSPAGRLRDAAFGIVMGFVAFLGLLLLFAADPLQRSLIPQRVGALTTVLKHVQMLFHPPVVFCGYAAWGIPAALAVAALLIRPWSDEWLRLARNWALAAWTVLGIGILLGGVWAYEVLGWGGYWSWDPVENGSFIPWLAGSALVHGMLAWQHRGMLKKTTLALAIAVFALCNFATFLTRSGIFSSLHEFSKSPIGWMFLVAMAGMGLAGATLIGLRRKELTPRARLTTVASREAAVMIALLAWLLLAGATLVGTLSVPLSQFVLGPKIVLGESYYNHVFIPTALVLLASTAIAPLLRWGAPPTAAQRRALAAAGAAGAFAAAGLLLAGVRHPVALAVGAAAGLAVAALIAMLVLDLGRVPGGQLPLRLATILAARRRPYAGFLIHLGIVCLAIGVCGSSLGSRKYEAALREGQSLHWDQYTIRFVRLQQSREAQRFVAQAELEVTPDGQAPFGVQPAQFLESAAGPWNGQVSIHSAWSGDFYAIFDGPREPGTIAFTFRVNPLIRWMWLSGWVVVGGTLIALWPARRTVAAHRGPPAPLGIARQRPQSARTQIARSKP